MSFENIDLQWFAAEDEGRTEEASEIRIDKARKEGRVAKSQELNGALVMFFGVLALILLAPWMLTKFIEIYIFFFSRCTSGNAMNAANAVVFFNYFAKLVLPVAFTGVIVGIIGNIIQNGGFIFSTKPLEPNFSKVLPHISEYLKKTVFSREGLFNVLKSIFKVAVIVWIAFVLIRRKMGELLFIIHQNGNVLAAVGKIASIAATLLVIASVIFIAVGFFDYFVIQRPSFLENLKMTKQEVKEEYKEMEGDPEVKNKLKEAQRALLRSNVPKAVRESDVVITNPTHFAVALKYDVDIPGGAPMVNAKGEDLMAQRIKQLARENDVPIVENRPLARGLYAEVDVGDIIPEAYFNAISVIYAQLNKFSKL